MQLITRRSSLQAVAVAAVAGVAGFFVARNSKAAQSLTQPAAANGYGAAPAASGKLLAPLSQVPTNGGLILGKEKVVLTRGSDETVHGFSSTCPHQGCAVGSVNAKTIDCPCHGSQFDTKTGAVITGPATSGLPSVAVVVRDGSVYTG